MTNLLSYVFTVNPGRTNRYVVPSNDLEIKSIIAADLLKVWLVDDDPGHPAEVELLYNETRIGTSILVGKDISMAFENTDVRARVGYVGALLQ
jgi:hypothetical protein